ncbi:MAG: SDR family NAD(P)-dependent oxidoreductase [Alphaproteobacteria bacterium]|nr:SDR family NAD(P)-dependent oxidoreductase [Alphaproteobacteria bacterium]MCW5740581.1 SDR family NAD(P)-dependent oxidoreductase [Alphaproteobacteria bacterium]
MTKIAVVTGSNRGIGLALVRGLCRLWGGGGVVYLTARRDSDGDAAIALLRGEGLSPEYHRLDLASEDSVTALARHIGRSHGGIDVVIQNGAYAPAPGSPAYADARPMIEANNHGSWRMLRAFRPLLRESARMLVVASGFGTLSRLPEHLQPMLDGDERTPDEIEAAMDSYVEAVEGGTARERGWPDWVNVTSKVGQVALTRAAARQWRADPDMPKDVLLNAVCPGWTITDATRGYLASMPEVSAKTPDEAAADVIWLATLPPDTTAPYGELVQYRKVIPFRG